MQNSLFPLDVYNNCFQLNELWKEKEELTVV